MDERLKKCALQIMHKILEMPLNRYWDHPVDPEADGLSNYNNIIIRPMDLGTINTRLENSYYHSLSDWYDDVILVYTNAIKYHKDNIYAKIAQYCKEYFEKIDNGFGKDDDILWMKKVDSLTEKITKLATNLPQKIYSTSFIKTLQKRAENMEQPSTQTIAEIVQKLNPLLKVDRSIREDVFAILQELGNIPSDAMGETPVNIEKLNPLTQNVLLLYLHNKEHSDKSL